MPERKIVASKTYVSRYKDLSFGFIPAGETVSDTILFVAGEFTTNLDDEQKHIESRDHYKHGVITVKPAVRDTLVATATSLRARAVTAGADAKAAQDALAKFDAEAKAAAGKTSTATGT